MFRTPFVALSFALTLGCQSTPAVVDTDPAIREPLLGALQSLEGRWEGASGDMQLEHEFHVTSGGSVVRELMFPGTPHEMTNMYSLDGNTIVMTHYCGEGNQPRMRATALEGNRIAFRSEGVSDLGAPDEVYMGEMTLVLVSDDKIEQHWTALAAGAVDHESVFELHRVK